MCTFFWHVVEKWCYQSCFTETSCAARISLIPVLPAERTGTQPCEGCRQQGWPLRRSYFQQHFRRGQHELTQQNSEVFIYKGPLSQAVKNLKVSPAWQILTGTLCLDCCLRACWLQRLSLGGCLASILGAPILVSGAGDAMPLAAQASLVVTIGGFGLFTTGELHHKPASLSGSSILLSDALHHAMRGMTPTKANEIHVCAAGLLHWFTSPYVHRLEHDRKTGGVTVETMSILGQPQISKFHESAVRYPNTIRPQVTFEVSLVLVNLAITRGTHVGLVDADSQPN